MSDPKAAMLLQTEHLTKDYGRHRALADLNLTIHPGEIFGILGPNGSGKTTALRLLLGFLRPSAGRACILGHDCWQDSVAARKKVAYLPGELRLYENMSGRDLVRFLCRLRGLSLDGHTAALARRFDIDLSRPLTQLSSGMKRKVALLSVLVPRTPLVILDEPTNTLDPVMRDELLAQLRHAREQGQTVLFSSHVLTEVEQVCTRVGILERGRLVHLQDMKDLRKGRLVKVRLADGVNGVPDLDGLRLRDQHDGQLILEHTGPLQPLLAWLADRNVVDLSLQPLGLDAIYHRYHGTPV